MQKFKPYDVSVNEEITEKNCQRLTGFDVYSLIGLSGIYAILDKEAIETYVLEGIYPNPKLTILAHQNQLHIEIELIIDELRIHNELILIKIPGDRFGLKIFLDQIQRAAKANFKFLTLEAAKGKYDDGTPYVGYKVWYKFGYIMIASSQIEFTRRMQSKGRSEATLLELLSQPTESEQKKAEELWEDIAFTWDGIFDLDENSYSQEILKKYLQERNLS